MTIVDSFVVLLCSNGLAKELHTDHREDVIDRHKKHAISQQRWRNNSYSCNNLSKPTPDPEPAYINRFNI